MPAIPAREALKRLQEGNRRFVNDRQDPEAEGGRSHRRELAGGQEPYAVIIGCSDSRVPVEIVFDSGFGDLFVIRVAGNVVAPSQIGSVEYAVDQLGTRLVVVLGHSGCGAVQATIDELQRPSERQSPNLKAIVDRIRPSVETLLESDLKDKPQELSRKGVRANARMSANTLRTASDILEPLVQSGELLVVGAEYSLETGEVDFFDGLPD